VKLVVDASVALKWFLGASEANLDQAGAVAAAIERADTELFAPPHWTAEVAAVLARLEPELMDDACCFYMNAPNRCRKHATAEARD
jgi:predicted nucleic acid-binding protein